MAPQPPCRLPRSLPPWLLLLLLSVALLGSQARAEPAAGSAVPAQSTCVAEGPRGAVTPPGCAGAPCLPIVPGAPAAVRRSGHPLGGRRTGGTGLGSRSRRPDAHLRRPPVRGLPRVRVHAARPAGSSEDGLQPGLEGEPLWPGGGLAWPEHWLRVLPEGGDGGGGGVGPPAAPAIFPPSSDTLFPASVREGASPLPGLSALFPVSPTGHRQPQFSIP